MSLFYCAPARLSRPLSLIAFLLVTATIQPASARPAGDIVDAPDISVVKVQSGDTLEGMLRGLGFKDQVLVELILAFSSSMDPDRLQPGERLEVVWSDRSAGQPERLTLTVNGSTIELDTSEVYPAPAAAHEPEVEWAERAVSVTVENTLIESLERSGAPSRLGLQLAEALSGVVDFSRNVHGGETVQVLYREEVLPEGQSGARTEISYARLEIEGRTLEIGRSDEPGAPLQVFAGGTPVRLSAEPVVGARISSGFGQRKHPILGTVRMHTGVDYAARQGTPVLSSAPGTVTFIGSKGGYGKTVEITHGSEIMTRYAHLHTYAKGLKVGDTVEAGESIGTVGATGLATGPHLHYEVRYAGRAVDPMSDERVAALAGPVAAERPSVPLEALRHALAETLKPKTRG